MTRTTINKDLVQTATSIRRRNKTIKNPHCRQRNNIHTKPAQKLQIKPKNLPSPSNIRNPNKSAYELSYPILDRTNPTDQQILPPKIPHLPPAGSSVNSPKLQKKERKRKQKLRPSIASNSHLQPSSTPNPHPPPKAHRHDSTPSTTLPTPHPPTTPKTKQPPQNHKTLIKSTKPQPPSPEQIKRPYLPPKAPKPPTPRIRIQRSGDPRDRRNNSETDNARIEIAAWIDRGW